MHVPPSLTIMSIRRKLLRDLLEVRSSNESDYKLLAESLQRADHLRGHGLEIRHHVRRERKRASCRERRAHLTCESKCAIDVKKYEFVLFPLAEIFQEHIVGWRWLASV